MTEVERIADQLKRSMEGKAWHGPALLEVLEGVTAQQAAAPVSTAHTIWEIVLHVAPEVQALLEQRRILIEDLQKVIHHAETTGAKLAHPKNGHFKASFKPYKVTFWVEYSPSGDGYIVHNAYSHRMEVSGGTLS